MISKNQQDFLVGALVGVSIATASTLLLTPLSGTTLRKKLQDGLSKLNGKLPKALQGKIAPKARASLKKALHAPAKKSHAVHAKAHRVTKPKSKKTSARKAAH